MGLLPFILNLFKHTEANEIFRCLEVSNTIIYKNGCILVCNDDYIYYYGSIYPRSKKFYTFYKETKHLLHGKRFYSVNAQLYKNRVKLINKQKGLYLCL